LDFGENSFDEQVIRSVVNRVNEVPAGSIPPEAPNTSESIID
jgi:hypothetical protein